MEAVLKTLPRRILLFWLLAFAITLNVFAMPLGGECLEENGLLCCVAADFLCLSPDRTGGTVAEATRETLHVAVLDDNCGEGHCYWLSWDSVPHIIASSMLLEQQEMVALLPPAVVVGTTAFDTGTLAYHANAPPGLCSVRYFRRGPRAPPFST